MYVCNCVPSVSICEIVKPSFQFWANSVSLSLSLLHFELGHSDHSLTSVDFRIKRKKQCTVVDFKVHLNISVTLEKIKSQGPFRKILTFFRVPPEFQCISTTRSTTRFWQAVNQVAQSLTSKR